MIHLGAENTITMTHTAFPPGKVMYVMGLVSQSDVLSKDAYQRRCTRHDLLIKYVDVHAVDNSAADYSPKTALILNNLSC